MSKENLSAMKKQPFPVWEIILEITNIMYNKAVEITRSSTRS